MVVCPLGPDSVDNQLGFLYMNPQIHTQTHILEMSVKKRRDLIIALVKAHDGDFDREICVPGAEKFTLVQIWNMIPRGVEAFYKNNRFCILNDEEESQRIMYDMFQVPVSARDLRFSYQNEQIWYTCKHEQADPNFGEVRAGHSLIQFVE